MFKIFRSLFNLFQINLYHFFIIVITIAIIIVILRSEFRKFNFRFGISSSKIPYVPNNFEFFRLNLGQLPNYVRYFGSYSVEGVAESWVEAEMSWVELGAGECSWMEVDGAGWRWAHNLAIPRGNL